MTKPPFEPSARSKTRTVALAALVPVFAFALFTRWWSDTHRPPVHALKVSIVEQDIPRMLKRLVRDDYSVPGELLAMDNMRELVKETEIEGGNTTWDIVKVEHRAKPSAPWTDRTAPADRKPPAFAGQSSLSFATLYPICREVGDWKITVSASRSYYQPQTKEEWVGSCKYTIQRTFEEDFEGLRIARDLADRRARGLPTPTPTPPAGVIPLKPNRDYVAGMQWAQHEAESWHDVPREGEKRFPLVLAAGSLYALRAQKAFPNEEWPNWSGGLNGTPIEWSGTLMKSQQLGDSLFVLGDADAPSVSLRDLKTISVRCGNVVTRRVLVVPKLEARSDLVKTLAASDRDIYKLKVRVAWKYGWHPQERICIRAYRVVYPEMAGRRQPTLTRVGKVKGPAGALRGTRPNKQGEVEATIIVPHQTGRIALRGEVFVNGYLLAYTQDYVQ